VGTQVLSARSARRIERATGQVIVRAWGHGGYVFGFVTPDHRHGWWDRKTGEWGFDEDPFHYTSCAGFYEDDEPTSDVVAAWERGTKGVTAPPDHQTDDSTS
jgi:hypothetical protein